MLTVYTDDSGTHAGSAIVVMACFIAPGETWRPFESAWKAKLLHPLDGKPPLQQFHMFDCVNRRDEFAGYSDPERDAVIKEFRDIILGHELCGRAIAVQRREWDSLITGGLELLWGDSIGFCIRTCATWAVKWAADNTGDHQAKMIFDDGPQHIRLTTEIVENLKIANGTSAGRAELFGPEFLPVKKFVPLQAADMLAWETYHYGLDWINDPVSRIRPHYQRLIESGKVTAGFCDRETIEQFARAFTVFRKPSL